MPLKPALCTFRLLATFGVILVTAGCEGQAEDTDPCTSSSIINSPGDLEALSHCESIEANIYISDEPWVTIIDLPQLVTMHGDFGIWDNDDLESINLPSLTSVGLDLSISRNGALTALSLPALTSVGDALFVLGNASLSSVDLPSLTDGGYLGVLGPDLLTDIEVLSLTTVDGLCISDHAWLTKLNMPALTASTSEEWGLDISRNTALTSLEGLSSLRTVGSYAGIYENDELRSLEGMSSLEAVGLNLGIGWNKCLSQTEAEAFAEAIDVGGPVSVQDNGINYPCD